MIKIADFGISRNLDNSDPLSSSSVGTDGYMSPEMINQTEYGPKTDIWSAGCVIFELIYLEIYQKLKIDVNNEKLQRKISRKLVQLLKM